MTAASVSEDILSPTNSHFLMHPGEVEDYDMKDADDIDFDRSDGDTASQRSISLSSPAKSPRTSVQLDQAFHGEEQQMDHPAATVRDFSQSRLKRDSLAYTQDTDLSSEQDLDGDDRSSFMRRLNDTPVSSAAPSLHESEEKQAAELRLDPEDDAVDMPTPSSLPSSRIFYPPPPIQKPDPRESVASFASGSTTYSKKARPESMLVVHNGPLILGIALVDFNHLVSPIPIVCMSLS
jgi:hypothetical protein